MDLHPSSNTQTLLVPSPINGCPVNSSLLEPEFLVPSALSEQRTISTKSSVFSLVATIVGGGCLSLPYALSQAGLIPGLICIFVFGLLSDFSVDLLLTCSRRTGASSYQQIAVLCFGKSGKYITMILIFVMIWLACVAYAVLMGDLFLPVIHFIFNLEESALSRVIVIICSVALVSPLCYNRHLGSLRGTSFLCLSSILILAIMLGIKAAAHFNEDHNVFVYIDHKFVTREMIANLQLWPKSFSKLLQVAPVFCVAYVCHFNVLPVQKELRRPTRHRIRRIIHSTMALCSFLYGAIAVLGYFWSMDETCGNILLNFDTHDVPMTVGRVALGLTVMLSFPLLVLPCRDTAHNMLGMAFPDLFLPKLPEEQEVSVRAVRGSPANNDDFLSRSVSLYNSPMRKGNASIVQSMSRQEEEFRTRTGNNSPAGPRGLAQDTLTDEDSWRNSLIPASQDPEFENALSFEASTTVLVIETTVILVSAVTLACFIPGIMVLWGLMGATVCMVIAFILPCLFWIMLRWDKPVELDTVYARVRKPFVVLLTVFSIVACVAFTVEAVFALDTPACPDK